MHIAKGSDGDQQLCVRINGIFQLQQFADGLFGCEVCAKTKVLFERTRKQAGRNALVGPA